MLAPGDCLTQPASAEPTPTQPSDVKLENVPTITASPAPSPGETENQSFLLTFLRVMGAIHS